MLIRALGSFVVVNNKDQIHLIGFYAVCLKKNQVEAAK